MDWKLGLNFYSTNIVLFNPLDLDQSEVIDTIQNGQYHIYLVGKRKKLFFDRCWKDEDESTKIQMYWLNDNHDKEFIGFTDSNGLWINSVKDGYYDYDFKDKKGLKIRDFSLVNILFSNFILQVEPYTPSIIDLEVMYIGQAFGRKQVRQIDYRLVNHEKIQRIALDVLNKGSNEEVLVIGVKVEVNDLAMLLATGDLMSRSNFSLQNMYDLQKKAAKRITEGQEITVFEASLIRYFQPELNVEHKQSFPSPDFDSYDEIYRTEFDYTAFGLDTKPVHTRVFSQLVNERKFDHAQHFPLRTKSDKKSLFEFLMEAADLDRETRE